MADLLTCCECGRRVHPAQAVPVLVHGHQVGVADPGCAGDLRCEAQGR